MATVSPPTAQELDSDFLRGWHGINKPRFGELVSSGYVAGATELLFTEDITGLTSGAGQVLFSEAKLGVPTALDADTMYLVSDNAADTQTFDVHGTDADDNLTNVTVTATGTTSVALSGTWNHIQTVFANSANTGTVYISTKSSGVPTLLSDQIQTVMTPALSVGCNPILVCAEDQVILIDGMDFTCDLRDTVTIRLFIDHAAHPGVFAEEFTLFLTQASFTKALNVPLGLHPGDRLRVHISAANTSNAAFAMNGLVMVLDPTLDPDGTAVLFR